jgi:hypothetical protein
VLRPTNTTAALRHCSCVAGINFVPPCLQEACVAPAVSAGAARPHQ